MKVLVMFKQKLMYKWGNLKKALKVHEFTITVDMLTMLSASICFLSNAFTLKKKIYIYISCFHFLLSFALLHWYCVRS